MYSRKKQGAISIIEGTDALTSDYLEEIDELLKECKQAGQPKVVFSFKNTPLLDSSGLEWLLDSLESCLSSGGNLKLAAPNPVCEDILRITGFLSKFEVYPDTLSAVGSYTH
ncbi:STAS domain protein [Polystyrenella longa]|uniref:STAS domain protein n=1 Tax=Polystyrenella longa TaxID=2528007 RepID=A0A518CRN9_9PLAN|nr:STAS domain-containing protein [Polystyrenella longa]QDU81892.1 STAS domain protein [Polystyrenella longa]